VLDLQIEAKKEEVSSLEAGREKLISQVNSYQNGRIENESDRFNVLEGSNVVQPKLIQMVMESKKSLKLLTSGYGLIESQKHGLVESFFTHPLRNKLDFRFLLTQSTLTKQRKLSEELYCRAKKRLKQFEARIASSGTRTTFRYLIKDEQELLLSLRISEDEETSSNIKDASLWTNNKILVKAFLQLFNETWHDSKELQTFIGQ
jgi:hypothetical protein